MADTLATLARLRHLQATTAKRVLADALRAEAQAEAALNAARQAPAQEARDAGGAQDGFLLATAFAAWLPLSAAAVRNHTAQAAAAGREREAAAASLRAAEGALEAVANLQREQASALRKATLRKAQVQLDEMGARRKAK